MLFSSVGFADQLSNTLCILTSLLSYLAQLVLSLLYVLDRNFLYLCHLLS